MNEIRYQEEFEEMFPRVGGLSTESSEESLKRVRERNIQLLTDIALSKPILRRIVREMVAEEMTKFQERSRITRVIRIRDADYTKAKKEVLDLVRAHKKGIRTLDIAERLKLDPEVVLKILMELREEGKIAKADERD